VTGNAAEDPILKLKDRLRQLRDAVGFPTPVKLKEQGDLLGEALAPGLSRQTVHDMLNGQSVPNRDTVLKFVNACRRYAECTEKDLPAEIFDLAQWEDDRQIAQRAARRARIQTGDQSEDLRLELDAAKRLAADLERERDELRSAKQDAMATVRRLRRELRRTRNDAAANQQLALDLGWAVQRYIGIDEKLASTSEELQRTQEVCRRLRAELAVVARHQEAHSANGGTEAGTSEEPDSDVGKVKIGVRAAIHELEAFQAAVEAAHRKLDESEAKFVGAVTAAHESLGSVLDIVAFAEQRLLECRDSTMEVVGRVQAAHEFGAGGSADAIHDVKESQTYVIQANNRLDQARRFLEVLSGSGHEAATNAQAHLVAAGGCMTEGLEFTVAAVDQLEAYRAALS